MKRLVILSPNWLGDAVMALPAIADVRRSAPGVSITIAARPAIAPLFAEQGRPAVPTRFMVGLLLLKVSGVLRPPFCRVVDL
jgi:heptosyltransferase-2